MVPDGNIRIILAATSDPLIRHDAKLTVQPMTGNAYGQYFYLPSSDVNNGCSIS